MPRLAGKVAFITGTGNGRRAMSAPLSASLGICPGGGGALVSIRAGIVGEELRCRCRRTLLPFTPIEQSVLGHIDRRWLPHLVQANGFRACRRRRQIDRAGHQRKAQETSPTRPRHCESP